MLQLDVPCDEMTDDSFLRETMKGLTLLFVGVSLLTGSANAFLTSQNRKNFVSLKAENAVPGFASAVEGIGYGKPECPQIATAPELSPLNKVAVFALG